MKKILIMALLLSNIASATGVEYNCFFRAYKTYKDLDFAMDNFSRREEVKPLCFMYTNLTQLQGTEAEAKEILTHAIDVRKNIVAEYYDDEEGFVNLDNSTKGERITDISFLKNSTLYSFDETGHKPIFIYNTSSLWPETNTQRYFTINDNGKLIYR